MLINDDFPTLERPINAYSGKRSFGHLSTSELLIVENFYAMLHVFIGLFIVGIFYPPVFAISIIGIVILVFILGFLIYSIEEKLFQKVIEIFKNIIERVKGSRK